VKSSSKGPRLLLTDATVGLGRDYESFDSKNVRQNEGREVKSQVARHGKVGEL
jgi:hypothetical protein